MTFSTEKNKIFKIWNDSIKNQFQISNLSDNDKIILSKTTQLNNKVTIYDNLIDLSSDWLIPDTILREVGEEEVIQILYKEYTIEINGINKNLIPYIESKISYRLGDSKISLPIPNAPGEDVPFDEEADLQINDVVEISDTEEESIKNIIYSSSIYLRDSSGLPEELQLKFYFNIVNPIYYQST